MVYLHYASYCIVYLVSVVSVNNKSCVAMEAFYNINLFFLLRIKGISLPLFSNLKCNFVEALLEIQEEANWVCNKFVT